MTLPGSLFAVATFFTLFCAAVNAYTLRLAYPLWRAVPPEAFPAYHREYLRRLTPVITLPHIVMFFSSALLVRWRPASFGLRDAVLLFLLDTGVVLVSAFVAGPIHSRFERTGRLDAPGLTLLIRISTLRTVMMLAASALLCLRVASAVSIRPGF